MADEVIKYEGTVLSNPIVPGSSIDKFATHKAQFGQGGWHEVTTITDRDNIPDPRLEVGMMVYVTSEAKGYILTSLDTTVSPSLKTWEEFKPGQGDYIRKITTYPLSSVSPLVDGEIIQYQGPTVPPYWNGYFYKDEQKYSYISSKSSDMGPASINIIDESLLRNYISRNQSAISGGWSDIKLVFSGTYAATVYATNGETEVQLNGFNSQEEFEHVGLHVSSSAGYPISSSVAYIAPAHVWTQTDVQPATDLVWGNIEGEITNQEDLNTELTNLQSQITDLKARGRYLSLWNASTGLAKSDPPTNPYVYQPGDYFIVGEVADEEGETNKRPTGLQYEIDVPSTVVETEELAVDDTYIFDGSVWHLQKNTQKTITFANIAGQPTDNTNLATALDAKADVSSIGDATLTITKSGVAVGSFSANATEDVTLDVDTDILPTQAGNEGKFLKTDGSHASWQEVKPIVWVSYVDE